MPSDANVSAIAKPEDGGNHNRMPVFHRFVRMTEEAVDDDGVIRMRISTDDAVDMGGWRESLAHDDGAVDISAARALLVNHNPDQIAGPLRGVTFTGHEADAEAVVNKDARLQSCVNVLQAIRDGALVGVSIGYTYSRKDCTIDEETRTVRVGQWRLLEVSLTPIPADASASVRSFPFDEPAPAAEAQTTGERIVSDSIDQPIQPGHSAADLETAKREAAEAAKREAKEVVSFARSFGVDAEAVIGMDMASAKDHVLEQVRSKLKAGSPAPAEAVQVVADSADKWMDEASKNISRYSTEQLLRRCAAFNGIKHDDIPVHELAERALARMSYSRGANKTTDSFSVLLGNTANKQLLNGFDMFLPTWDQFCTIKDAVNFNTHSHVGVATGRLTETAEGVAYPELNQKEGSYSSTLKKWGATISVTLEALVNDELGEIMRSFSRAGYAAARTIERQVYSALLNATWTNDATTSAGLGTAGKIDAARAALKGKLSPAGEKMENDAAIIIVDPVNRFNAEAATGQLYGNATGANAQTGSNATRGIRVVDSTFVGDTSIYGSALTTDWYLLNDPNIVDTIVVEFLRGMRAPQIQEFDAAAVDATNYKIRLPFQATIATHTDSAGNARVTGGQRAKA
jgi:phage head maturation protease